MLRANLLISLIVLTLFSSFFPKNNSTTSLLVIGGEYTVQPGEIRHGDALLLMARVKIAEGGTLDGNIRLYGSHLEVGGQVDGDIHSYGGQVSLSPVAQVQGTINTIYSLTGLPRFPSILISIS